MGRVQLKHYDRRMAEIDRAMNRFWDLLEDTPGVRAHRPPAGSGSTMGGWCVHFLVAEIVMQFWGFFLYVNIDTRRHHRLDVIANLYIAYSCLA